VAGPFEHDNEISDFIKAGEFLDCLNDSVGRVSYSTNATVT
jgi:hypothetical protein